MECLAAQSQCTSSILREKDMGKHQYWMTKVGNTEVGSCDRDGNEILKLHQDFPFAFMIFLELFQEMNFSKPLTTK